MEPVEIDSPVKGTWAFMNPPGHPPLAKDFLAVGKSGYPYSIWSLFAHIFFRLKVEKTFTWQEPIYSPFSGVAIKIENTCEDRITLNIIKDLIRLFILAKNGNRNDFRLFGGNYIIIESGGTHALFAHLRKNSILIKEGDKVLAGDKIAKAGNSGASIQPHLHFQLMKDNNPFSNEMVPFVFRNHEEKRDGEWVTVSCSLPDNKQQFRT